MHDKHVLSFYTVLGFVSARMDTPTIYLKSGLLIDAREQRLAHCEESDRDAWHRALFQCETRGLILCSVEEYLAALDERQKMDQVRTT